MTDEQHHDKFDCATELSDAQGHVTLSEQEAHEIGARLRSLGEKLKTYEDLSDAGSDVQLLRMGYAAARLEIESLRAAPPAGAPQPGATYNSTQATNCACCGERKHTPLRIDAMGGYVCLTCIDKKLSSLLGEFGYEKAPAQAAPAAVAPPSAITASIMRDDGGEQSAFCLMVAYRSEKDARAALAMIAAPPEGMVAGGYLDNLKLMMEHSAFAGALQLDDALANIDEFACASLSANAVAQTPAHIKAMERAWLWMESQADSQSKGGHATFDLMMLREERDALRAAIDAAPTTQPSPQQEAQAGAVPMSHKDAKALVLKYGADPLHLVLQVERHHGIKGDPHGTDT